MLDLNKTTDLVKNELENDLYLLELLEEDLINVSALSRKIFPKVKEQNNKATKEYISIAIKRYVESKQGKKTSNEVAKMIANSQLSIKNDILHLTFKRNDFMLKTISEISKKINWDNEEIFFMNQGSGEVTIIIDEKNEELLEKCKEHLIERTDNLAILSLRENREKGLEKTINTPGVYSHFINQLSRKGINILEIVSTLSQITFVLDNKDIMRAYGILENNIKYFRGKLSK